MNKEAKKLQEELSNVISKAEKTRKMLRICRAMCYLAILLYIAFILIFPDLWETNMMVAIAVPLVIFLTGSGGLALVGRHFINQEQRSVKRLLQKIFPEAKCNIRTFELYPSLINASFFFGDFDYALSLGTLTFSHNGQKLEFKDVLINQNLNSGFEVWRLKYGHVFLTVKSIFGGIFTRRIENMPSSFRGLFAHTRIGRNINCGITILPSGIGERKDYLAKTFRSVIHVRDNEMIQFKDTEFEQYFKVYTTNGTVARILITPSVMSKLTELRKMYKRDVMLSFVGDLFFFAVYMPEGFITTGNSTIHNVEGLEDLYDSVATARSILREINLDSIPAKAAQ